ncbi:MAG: hypothetical protein N3B13_01615 [Deltaproteobacteria bacterium]|nr:hypothetical protein [Deltaproteobacteria bacterium]
MAIDFIKMRLEQMIKDMMLAKEQTVSNLYKYLAETLPESELQNYEIERIISNYEAICGNYVKQSRKKLLRSLNYLNHRLYSRIRPELSQLNLRLERIAKKMQKLQRLADE